MKVLIISDSHGKSDLLNRIVKKVNADHVIHCGDFCTDQSELPSGSLTVVRGNCDWEEVPLETIWERDGIRFFITHGHRYQVKSTPLPMRYRTEEVGAHIGCFGHSHYPFCEKVGRVLLINPGSISMPRGFPVPTFAVLYKEGKKVTVNYYDIKGNKVKERGFRGEIG